MSEQPVPADEDAPPADGWEYSDMPVDLASGEIHDEPSGDDPVLGLLAEIQAEQQLQSETLESIKARIADIEDDLKAVPDGPWNWANLVGEERRKLWQRLFEWVAWLEDRYLRHLSPSKAGIPEFHADWYRHPVAVEMLTALMVAHAAAYRRKAAPPSFALVDWHERCLWPTLARMEALNLFPRDTITHDWDGPTQRPTRRDETRFARWCETDSAPPQNAP